MVTLWGKWEVLSCLQPLGKVPWDGFILGNKLDIWLWLDILGLVC